MFDSGIEVICVLLFSLIILLFLVCCELFSRQWQLGLKEKLLRQLVIVNCFGVIGLLLVQGSFYSLWMFFRVIMKLCCGGVVYIVLICEVWFWVLVVGMICIRDRLWVFSSIRLLGRQLFIRIQCLLLLIVRLCVLRLVWILVIIFRLYRLQRVIQLLCEVKYIRCLFGENFGFLCRVQCEGKWVMGLK